MKRDLCKLTIMLAIFILFGILPATAEERAFMLNGAGEVTFTFDEQGNPIAGILEASGTATHVGLWTQVGTLTNFAPTNDPNTITATGDSIFTAINGDELDVLIPDAVLELDPGSGTGTATGTFVFIGGTGRFEEASGSAAFIVQQDLDGPFVVTAQGSIDF